MIATRSIIPSELPLRTGRWVVDPAHSAVAFSIRHLGLARVRGHFGRFEVTIDVGPDLAATDISASIDLDSINTNNADRDTHLRSSDFFSTDIFPTMTFISTEITVTKIGWKLSGLLTLNGITKPITLDVEFNGLEEFPELDKRLAAFSATTSLRRSEFGISYGMLPFGADKLALSDEVKIELDLEFMESQV